MYLHTPAVEVDSWFRVDTASGSDTPTTVYYHDGADPIGTSWGTTGSTVKNSTRDGTARFWSATATLYLKQLTYQGVPSGTVVTSTGVASPPPPADPVAPGAFAQKWAAPAVSTTLTGALAAWTVAAVDCTAGAGARTLPAASSVPAGTEFAAKKADTSSNSLVVGVTGGDVVLGTGAGSSSKTLTLAGEAATFVSDGVSKFVVRSSDTPVAQLDGRYGQLWTSPAASTTLTGTLAAWTITAVDCTAGAGARTLPAANSVIAGTAVCAKKADTTTNALVVSRSGSDLIFGTGSGATSKTLTLAGEAVEFVSNGSSKWTVRSSDTPSGSLAATYVPSSGGSLSRYGQPTPATSDLDYTNYVAPNAAAALSITTYVGGNNDVVEPSVYYNPNGWNGYEFWMAAGPYENSSSAVENPSIWASHDGQTWVVPGTNPVQGPPGSGNYDDPHLFEYQNTLYLTWNWSRGGGLPDQVLMSSSTDGVTWTSAVVLVTGVDGSGHELVSPHVEWHNGTWHMWALNIVGTRKVQHRTATSITGTWSAAADCTMSLPSGLDHWEFEVRRVGGQWVMLQTLVNSGQSAAGGRLYLRTSADGVTWTLPPYPVLQASLATGSPFDANFIYKSTFVPLTDGRIAIWYSAGNGTPRWKIAYTVATRTPNKTPMTSGGSALWYAAPYAAASTGILIQAEEWYQPVYFDRATLLANIGIEITTPGASGALIRLGIRSDTGDGRPLRLLLDAGTIDGTQTAGIYAVTAPIYVGPGWVWFTATGQGSPATQATVRTTSGNCGLMIGSTNTLSSQNSLAGYKLGGSATAALPVSVTFTSLSGKGAVARVLWQPA